MGNEARERLFPISQKVPGEYILYWVQYGARIRENPSLNRAVELANQEDIPLLVAVHFDPDYPGSVLRTREFFLQGILELGKKLGEAGVGFCWSSENVKDVFPSILRGARACVFDRVYLRHAISLQNLVLSLACSPVHRIDGNVVVPAEVASTKKEYSAATLRRKISPLIPFYLQEDKLPTVIKNWNSKLPSGWNSLEELAHHQGSPSLLDQCLSPGEDAGEKVLQSFLSQSLSRYSKGRNLVETDFQSRLSVYLHYGQLSPVRAARLALEAEEGENSQDFVEQLVVRRELAFNYVLYEKNYDNFLGLPQWARENLEAHATDPRPYLYTYQELEDGLTHDRYWNAAQLEMKITGKMHGYMRMYWGKKILEWSPSPSEGLSWANKLNDTWSLDGRDPNGYTGVAWCFGLHDRPWAARAVFGNVRYMNDRGLERKFKMEAYLQRINLLKNQ